MKPKQIKVLKIAIVIFAISMLIMAITEVVNVVNHGWEAFNATGFIPFVGIMIAWIFIMASGKEKKK